MPDESEKYTREVLGDYKDAIYFVSRIQKSLGTGHWNGDTFDARLVFHQDTPQQKLESIARVKRIKNQLKEVRRDIVAEVQMVNAKFKLFVSSRYLTPVQRALYRQLQLALRKQYDSVKYGIDTILDQLSSDDA